MKKIVLTIFILTTTIYAEQHIIVGEREGKIDSSNYIVTEDIIVAEDTKLEFLPGSKLSFNPYCGIKVRGELKLDGCILKSSDDNKGNWIGINVSEKGKIDFKDVIISGSIFGVIVPDSSSIKKFKNITFQNNKKSLQINEMSYTNDEKPISIYKLNSNNMLLDNSNILNKSSNKKNTFKNKNILKIGTVFSLITLSAICIYYSNEHSEYAEKYKMTQNNEDASRYITKSDKFLTYSIISGVGAGLSGIAMGVTIFY